MLVCVCVRYRCPLPRPGTLQTHFLHLRSVGHNIADYDQYGYRRNDNRQCIFGGLLWSTDGQNSSIHGLSVGIRFGDRFHLDIVRVLRNPRQGPQIPWRCALPPKCVHSWINPTPQVWQNRRRLNANSCRFTSTVFGFDIKRFITNLLVISFANKVLNINIVIIFSFVIIKEVEKGCDWRPLASSHAYCRQHNPRY